MDFGKLMEVDCGQSNPISQLVQHVTQDQTDQENIGNPSAPGLMQYHSMPPQSFRLNDLMGEMEQTDPQRLLMPTSVPNHQLPSTSWAVDYQQQFQENAHAKFEQSWDEVNAQNCENKPNNFYFQGVPNEFPPPQNKLRESHHFAGNVHYQNNLQMYPQKQVEGFGKITQAFDTFKIEDGIMINDLDELEDGPEENCTKPQEVHSEPMPEPNKVEIREFASANEFYRFLLDHVDQHNEEGPKLFPSKETYKKIQKSLLNLTNYSHIENNPMRYESGVALKGKIALISSCFSKAVLYLDAATQQEPTNDDHWLILSFALHLNMKVDQSIMAAKRCLDLSSDSYLVSQMICISYLKFGCAYQVCQSVFHWLKNNKLYNHLIPPDFTMDNKKTIHLKKGTLDTVKNLFKKAAQQNPANPDGNLQGMMHFLYDVSYEFDKGVDCNFTAFNSTKKDSEQYSYEMHGAGCTLFAMQKPYEALDTFFTLLTTTQSKLLIRKVNTSIGMVYMYLKNYKEAIQYLKKGIDPKYWPEEHNSNYEANTIEDQYRLCLDLYLKCQCKSIISNTFDKMKINDH